MKNNSNLPKLQLEAPPSDEDSLNNSDTGGTATTTQGGSGEQTVVTSQSFETYVVNVSRSVDHIIALDRLRQELAWRALLLGNESVSRVRKDDVISMISRTRRNNNRASSVYSMGLNSSPNNHAHLHNHDSNLLHPNTNLNQTNSLNLTGFSPKTNSYLNNSHYMTDQNT